MDKRTPDETAARGPDRRQQPDPAYPGPERRTGERRGAAAERRTER